jgi:hypothetical protein
VYCYVITYPIIFFNLTNLANSVGALCMDQGWAKLVLIALERYSVVFKRLTFNLR